MIEIDSYYIKLIVMASVVLSRTDMEVLLFFEVIDIFLSGVFLVVFASRICYLKSLSTTNKYKSNCFINQIFFHGSEYYYQ